MRAAIYARFSSELQDERSIADQVALARKYAEARGLTISQSYRDAAISGASTLNRPGLRQLLTDAAKGAFEVVVTESLDRLSRSQADIAALYEKLTFLNVRVETLADGAVSEIHVGLKGTMSALFLKDLAQKTRRGQVGRVKAGRIPGGKSYGYDVVKGGEDRGQRTINAAEATIVRRIYSEYAKGKGPLAIVRDLNREKVPGPTGGVWNASALLGSPKRRNGILNNELYHGTIVYNRQRFIKDPDTGKRVARENPESEWQRQSVPHLCVIDDEIWDAVQRRRAERGGPHLYQRRRPKRPLSGLIYCGACGSRYIVATHDYLRCSGRVNSGICDCSRTIEMREVEQRVLGALRRNLLASDVVADAVETYRRERMRFAAERRQSRGRLEADLADVERKINRMLKMVEDGHAEPAVAGPRLNKLAQERRDLEAAMAAEPQNKIVEVFPNAAERYAKKAAEIHKALANGKHGELDAVAHVRSLIRRIVVKATPAPNPLEIEVEGTLAVLIKNEEGNETSDIVRCVPPQPSLIARRPDREHHHPFWPLTNAGSRRSGQTGRS
jgi:DNA invertase Pin-like site-specific DNA recombinase